MNKMKLENISKYVSDKILWNLVDENNFISTDNMIPNKGGVIKSEYLPQKGYIYAYKKGDILLSNIRPYFKKVWLADKDGGCSSDILVLRPIKVTPEYLYAVLSQDRFFQYDMAGTKGSKMPRGDKKHIMNFPVLKLKNTIKIGYILQILNQKIELNNKINTELEAMAKTIYDYWFLQFEFPNEEGKPYKSSGGKMVWNEELKREIPEGWTSGRLAQYIKSQKSGDWGKEFPEKNYQKEVTCIRGTDFSAITNFENTDMPKRFILEKNSFKCLSDYDLLIEISGGSPTQSTGRICYIDKNVLKRFSTNLITSNFCKAFSLTDDNYFYWFYMLWKTLYINNVFFNYESKTTGVKNLLFDTLCEKYPICTPPPQIIKLYNQSITPYFNKIQQNILENQELTSLRDFLLPLLMNGQVGFKEDKT